MIRWETEVNIQHSLLIYPKFSQHYLMIYPKLLTTAHTIL